MWWEGTRAGLVDCGLLLCLVGDMSNFVAWCSVPCSQCVLSKELRYGDFPRCFLDPFDRQLHPLVCLLAPWKVAQPEAVISPICKLSEENSATVIWRRRLLLVGI